MVKRLVSSTNKRILDPILLTISLYTVDARDDPSIEPCGTPALM